MANRTDGKRMRQGNFQDQNQGFGNQGYGNQGGGYRGDEGFSPRGSNMRGVVVQEQMNRSRGRGRGYGSMATYDDEFSYGGDGYGRDSVSQGGYY